MKKGYKQTDIGVIPQDWDVKRLKDIAAFYSGGTPLTSIASYYGGDISWITSSDLNKQIINEVNGRITPLGLDNSSAKMVEKDTLLIAMYGATAGVTAITKIRAAINQAVLAVIPQSDETLFLYYVLSFFKNQIINTYTQGGQPNLSSEIIKSISIALPAAPSEQRAIAAALSDVDALLNSLDALIAKKRLIKQGAMQELLTGKKRLPGFSGEWEKCSLSALGTFSKGRGIKKDEVVTDGIPCIRYGEIYTLYNDYIRKFYSFISRDIAKQSQLIKKGNLLFTGSGETAEGIGKGTGRK